jgi:hypothetical protein
VKQRQQHQPTPAASQHLNFEKRTKKDIFVEMCDINMIKSEFLLKRLTEA